MEMLDWTQMGDEDGTITGTQAKAADRYAIDELKIPSLDLMERASACVAEEVLQQDPGKRVLVLCGVGNNGADGVCIARMLREAGREVRVLICGDLRKATWEFLWQLASYRKDGGAPDYADRDAGEASETKLREPRLPEAEILVDAVFGIGLKRPVEGPYRALLAAAEAHPSYKIAVDVPSGIQADTGEVMGICVHADKTVTFGRNKTGLVTGEGPAAAGEVWVCDIGIPAGVYCMVTGPLPPGSTGRTQGSD